MLLPRCSSGYWQEFRADRTAAMSNVSYAEGGVELMNKCKELDTLLR